MIVYDYIKNFILENININLSEELRKLEEYALKENVPIIDKEVQNLLSMLLSLNKPKTILEFGTAIGFSSIFMYEQLNGNVNITTMERDSDRIRMALENFKKFNCKDNIEIIEGDCIKNIKNINKNYDFIFIDSSKSHYGQLFESCIQILNANGIIVFDNILYKGMVASDELATKRKKTIVKNMRNFVKNIASSNEFSTVLLPIGDGIMILRRKS